MGLTEQQLEQRKNGLGASEIGAVAGLSPWSKPIDVWLRKTGRHEDDADASGILQRGHDVEDMIAQWYRAEQIEKVGGVVLSRYTETLVGDEPWEMATPDRLAMYQGTKRMVEIKNVGFRVLHHWQDDQATYAVPDYVRCQNLWQQHVVGIHAGDVAAWLGGRDFEVFPIEWEPDVVDDLRQIGREFWNDFVLKDIAPPVDASDSWAAYIQRRFPSDTEPARRATAKETVMADELSAVKHRLSVLQDEKALGENLLKESIGNASGLIGEGWKIGYKQTKSGGMDWKGVAVEHSNRLLAENCMSLEEIEEVEREHRREGSRRFLFTDKRGSK